MRRYATDAERRGAGDIELESMMGKASRPPQLLALAEPATRSGFVRKVYGILALQLLGTLLLAGLVVVHGRAWLASKPGAVTASVTASCALSLALAAVFSCYPELMRQSPTNYVLLAMLTAAESVLVGFACIQYTMGSVILCLGITAAVVLGLSFYALWTKNDLTTGGPYLLCCMLVLFGTGLALSAVASLGLVHSTLFSTMQVLYAGGGALVFSIVIVHDTQLIVGGAHSYEFSVDDYAMAAICLYLDILQLFLSLLRLIGRPDDQGL